MDALPSREKSIEETPDYKQSALPTIHELPHVLDKSVVNSERMSCSGLGLVLRQSVKPLQDCPDVLLLEKSLYNFDCIVLSKVQRRRRTDSLGRPCLSFCVPRPSAEMSSTRILATTSSIAGVGGICV